MVIQFGALAIFLTVFITYFLSALTLSFFSFLHTYISLYFVVFPPFNAAMFQACKFFRFSLNSDFFDSISLRFQSNLAEFF